MEMMELVAAAAVLLMDLMFQYLLIFQSDRDLLHRETLTSCCPPLQTLDLVEQVLW
jgi:hypothetical protein